MSIPSQKELKDPGPLLNPDGSLADIGWARQPLLDCNLENARFYGLRFLQPLRIKCWDYYGIFTPDRFYSFTISDIGYIGMVFAYVVDFKDNTYHEETLTLPLAKNVKLPRNSTQGGSSFDNGKVSLEFQILENSRRLIVNWPGFGSTDLSADVTFSLPPEHESMTIVIPIPEKRFYYNRKINNMPAKGWVKYQGKQEEITPDKCLGGLDWGRGVWAYNSFWLWASTSGFLADGRRIGLNLGYGFGDNSAATENAFILNGKIHKLEQVEFVYSAEDYKKPWKMRSDDGRLMLTFTPFLERVAKTDLKVLYSEVHQMFGRYEGTLKTKDGEIIQVSNLIGFAEEHHARW